MTPSGWLVRVLFSFFFIATELAAQDFTRIITGPVVTDDRYSEGSSWGDINNNDYLDLFIPHAFSDRSNLLFINNGDGSFDQVTGGPVITDTSTSSGCSFGDFDNDGQLDLFVQNWNGISSHLYMNQGGGAFIKVNSGEIVNDGGWSFNSSIVDYDNDGNLDIYVDNGAFTTFVESNFLYRGNGDGTFTKITAGDIVNDNEHCLSSSWCDFDNDGDQDLFTANSDPFNGIPIDNFLYLNNGDGSFTRLTEGAVVTDNSISIGGSWGDYDNDGDFDLFVANWFGEDNHLYQNLGDGTFTLVTTGDIVNDGGNSVSGTWGDYDNDGDLDIYVTNDWNENNFLYRNNGNSTFTRILEGDIVNDGGRSNGATWIDYDNDGWIDMYVPNGQNPDQSNFLYRNNGISENHWINIRCTGNPSNASAIGTRVRARAVLSSQIVWQMREVSGHQGFNAQGSFNIEIGLENATVIDSLVFEWPSGAVEIYIDVVADHFYSAIEGEGLSIIQTGIEEESFTNQQFELCLTQNLPNPFGRSTSIPFSILGETGSMAHIRLIICDISGRRVRTLMDAVLSTGSHVIDWDGKDDSGRQVPSGVYIYFLTDRDQVSSGRMILLD